MAFPPPAAAVAVGPLNPIEAVINGLNTNPYLIGSMMLVMNLGGRHLASTLTPEQDKFFQNPWVRRSLLFVVIFVATRNILTAFWLSIGILLIVGYLTNETSALYLFGPPKPPAPAAPPPPPGLTAEEQEIFKRLQEKADRAKAAAGPKPDEKPVEEDAAEEEVLYTNYLAAMRQIQTLS